MKLVYCDSLQIEVNIDYVRFFFVSDLPELVRLATAMSSIRGPTDPWHHQTHGLLCGATVLSHIKTRENNGKIVLLSLHIQSHSES